MVVRLKIAAPMPVMQKIQSQIFVIAPNENHLIFGKQVENECLQLQGFRASVIQVAADDQLVGALIFKKPCSVSASFSSLK